MQMPATPHCVLMLDEILLCIVAGFSGVHKTRYNALDAPRDHEACADQYNQPYELEGLGHVKKICSCHVAHTCMHERVSHV